MPVATDYAAPPAPETAQRTELILAQIDQLPTLSAVALRMLEASQSSASDVQDVSRLIAADPALTARILSLVKRADLGLRGDNMTVARAVVLLGLDAVRSAVLAIKVFETFAAMECSTDSSFDRTEFWKHSLAVACASRLIAGSHADKAARRVPPEEAFIAGLLHDLGKLALHACLPKSYARVVAAAATRRVCLCDLERETFGVDHTVVGRRLTARWRLPKYVPDCCWLHHHPIDALPPSRPTNAHIAIVHLADQWVRRQRIGYSGSTDVEPLANVAGQFGLSETQLDDLGPTLVERVEEQCALIGLGDVSTAQLYNRALADANEELARMNLVLASSRQRIEARERCFEALAAFTGRLSVRDDLVDVCRAVAKSVGELWGVLAVATFALHAGDRMVTVAWQVDDRNGCDLVLRSGLPDGVGRPRVVGPARLISPPDWAQPVVEYLEGRADSGWHPRDVTAGATGPLMLPIVHGSACVGGVLLGTAPLDGDVEQVAVEIESLSTAFGLAMAAAADRADSSRLHEELATANRQLRQTQGQVIRSRSISMIAEMAAGAAHELNNPLAVIAGRAQLLLLDAEDGKLRQALEIIDDQARRCSAIVSELMAFAKPTPPTRVSLRLVTLLDSVGRHWLSASGLSESHLSWSVADPATTVYADPAHITQALDALIANAVEAAPPETVRIHINSAARGSDESVVVSVEDNGTGMSAEVLEHALDPFFSYRSAGRGRGLGLSKAYRLVEINGGRLWLESALGAGTRAFIELPSRPS